MDGKLSITYVPVRDLKSALKFYRDQLGLEEAWRMGDSTVAFKLPGTDIELMIDLFEEGAPDTVGPMFLIPSVDEFYAAKSGHNGICAQTSRYPSWALGHCKGPFRELSLLL